MMKSVIYTLIIIASFDLGAQDFDRLRDSLKHELESQHADTTRSWLLYELTGTYRFNRPDSAIYYGAQARRFARKINFPQGEVAIIRFMAISYITMGNYSKAMQLDLEGLRLAEKHKLANDKVVILNHLGQINAKSQDYTRAILHYKASLLLADSTANTFWATMSLKNLGETFLNLAQLDSAKHYLGKALDFFNLNYDGLSIGSQLFVALGRMHYMAANVDSAEFYFRTAIDIANTTNSKKNQAQAALEFAKFSLAIKTRDTSEFYARQSLDIALDARLFDDISRSSDLLSNIYKTSDIKKAFEFKEMAMAYQDSLALLNQKVANKSYLDYDELDRHRELETARLGYQTQLRYYALLAGLLLLFVISIFLYRDNKAKQRSKLQIEHAYDKLKSTQSQLIQSEKMASLGELTAGIAHEIQNPLNFVNNFSEVNTELIDELKKGLAVGSTQLAEELIDDIKANEEKINHHGKRADAIVKGMLQHSRTSSGVREPTDINALCDEYLRLSYHGLRAKDKSFNAKFETDFDSSLPKINVVPQDIGRVVLNLINNAFYAVNERQKLLAASFKLQANYEPTVSVSTKKEGSKVLISVKDNGNGIPDSIKEKIFQPFFTTKPTGQGTGLGLSLSYDIVKAHGGEIRVESEEGKGTEFTIQIPIS